ncbi:MAG: hypothetical protein WAL80_02970 [Xanthobacteraceae bacterium]|jgi:hypothetical protein
MSVLAVESATSASHASGHSNIGNANVCDILEISASRTYDCALEILGAYKLTGNFALDLEIVLKSLGVLGRVTFEIKPKSILSDCRRVELVAGANLGLDEFRDILRTIESRVGSDSTPLSWKRLFLAARRSEQAS